MVVELRNKLLVCWYKYCLIILIKLLNRYKIISISVLAILLVLNILQTFRDVDFKNSTYKLKVDEYDDFINHTKGMSQISIALLTDSTYIFYKNPVLVLSRVSNNIYCENITYDILNTKKNVDKYTFDKNIKNLSFSKFNNKIKINNNIENVQFEYLKNADIDYLLISEKYRLSYKFKSVINRCYKFPTHKMVICELKKQKKRISTND